MFPLAPMHFLAHEFSVNGGDAPRQKKQACSHKVAGDLFLASPQTIYFGFMSALKSASRSVKHFLLNTKER